MLAASLIVLFIIVCGLHPATNHENFNPYRSEWDVEVKLRQDSLEKKVVRIETMLDKVIADCQGVSSNRTDKGKLQQNVDNLMKMTQDQMALTKDLTRKTEELINKECRTNGLISGSEHRVSDTALTASTMFWGQTDHGPQCSRMYVPKPKDCTSFAWVADKRQNELWIQVDLGTDRVINTVGTQGRGGHSNDQYVTSYKLASYDRNRLVYYLDQKINEPKVFAGNSDIETVVRHNLIPPLNARRVRLYVLCYNYYPSLRWELYD